MSETIQTIIAAGIVLAAVLYLVLRGRKKAGCGKGCGCDPKKAFDKLPPGT